MNLSILLFLSSHLFLCKNRQPAAAILLSKSKWRKDIKSNKILHKEIFSSGRYDMFGDTYLGIVRVAPWQVEDWYIIM